MLLGAIAGPDIGALFPPSDPQWKNDAGMKAFDAFLTKYFPEGNRTDASVMYGYTVAQGLVHVLKGCGDNLTRANVMKQAASIREIEIWWPVSGLRQSFRNVQVDRAYRIVEGRNVIEPVMWKSFEIGKSKIAHPMEEL